MSVSAAVLESARLFFVLWFAVAVLAFMLQVGLDRESFWFGRTYIAMAQATFAAFCFYAGLFAFSMVAQ